MVCLVIGLTLGACGDDDNSATILNMEVTATSPAQGSSGIFKNAAVSATFNGELDCETVSKATYTIHSGPTGTGAGVDGTLNCAADTITFSPTGAGFSYATTYTARVGTDVKNAAGQSLASAVSWSFRIKAASSVIKTGGDFNLARDGDGAAFSWGATGQSGRGATTRKDCWAQVRLMQRSCHPRKFPEYDRRHTYNFGAFV